MGENASKLVGQTAHIKDGGWYEGHWGTIIAFDGTNYHISGGSFGEVAPIFGRDEFTIHRAMKGKKDR